MGCQATVTVEPSSTAFAAVGPGAAAAAPPLRKETCQGIVFDSSLCSVSTANEPSVFTPASAQDQPDGSVNRNS